MTKAAPRPNGRVASCAETEQRKGEGERKLRISDFVVACGGGASVSVAWTAGEPAPLAQDAAASRAAELQKVADGRGRDDPCGRRAGRKIGEVEREVLAARGALRIVGIAGGSMFPSWIESVAVNYEATCRGNAGEKVGRGEISKYLSNTII